MSKISWNLVALAARIIAIVLIAMYAFGDLTESQKIDYLFGIVMLAIMFFSQDISNLKDKVNEKEGS